jgi:hypothetical protein
LAPYKTEQNLTGRHVEMGASVCKAKKMGCLENEWVGLKIRRYLVPWGFNSPSRHQLSNPTS